MSSQSSNAEPTNAGGDRAESRRAGRRLVDRVAFTAAPVVVADRRAVTGRVTQVVLHGAALAEYQPRPADTIRLLIPPHGEAAPVLASYGDDGFPYWPDGVARPTLRTYAVRRAEPGAAALTIYVARHQPTGHWLDTLADDHQLLLYGTRHGFEPPAGGTGGVGLVTDVSGLGPTAAIIEALPADTTLTVVAEVPSVAEQALLPDHPGLTVHWTIGSCSHGADSPLERLARGVLHGLAAVRVYAERDVVAAIRSGLLAGGTPLTALSTIVTWIHGMDSDARDAHLLPRWKRAATLGLDLRDLDVLDAIDLDLELPRSPRPHTRATKASPS